MNGFPQFILIVSLIALLVEITWSLAKGRRVYAKGEVLANLALLFGNQLLRPVSLAWKGLVFGWIMPYRLFELPATPAVALLTFVAVEFVYYWYHRLSHERPFLWTIHHTHHSSTLMNYTTAFRLNWLGAFIGPLMFIPLILMGFSPKVVLISLLLGLLYQFFLHTQMIGHLGFLEGWLNTPAAHRVHHGSNPRYLDKNYGAVLMVFDRLFGTWEPESEPVRYGVTTGPLPPNPLVIVFGPLFGLLRRQLARTKPGRTRRDFGQLQR